MIFFTKDFSHHLFLQMLTILMLTTPTANGKIKTVNKFNKTCNFWTRKMFKKHLPDITTMKTSTRKCLKKRKRYMNNPHNNLQEMLKMRRIIGMIVAVWILQVKQSSKVNFQITNEELPYWCLPIIIFQMRHQLINPMLRRNHLRVLNLSLINSLQGPKNTGREILTVLQVAKLVLVHPFRAPASPILTYKWCHKKVKKENNTEAPTCNHLTIPYPTLQVGLRKKEQHNNLRKGANPHHRTLLCFKTEQ